MLVGYARTSTADQEAGLEAQVRDLQAAGCERVFAERLSSVATQRPRLEEALSFVREGDVLVVTKPDRLARSMKNLVELIDVLKARKVALRILSMDLDTSTATGELILNVLGSVAQFERALMLERQKEGIAKAKAEKKYTGRAPTARRQAGEVLKLREAGVGPGEIAKRLGMGVASVHRITAEARKVSERT